MFYFHHFLGKIPNFTNIFQRAWNYQKMYPPAKFNNSPLKIGGNPIFGKDRLLTNHSSGVNSLLNFGGALWILFRCMSHSYCEVVFPHGNSRSFLAEVAGAVGRVIPYTSILMMILQPLVFIPTMAMSWGRKRRCAKKRFLFHGQRCYVLWSSVLVGGCGGNRFSLVYLSTVLCLRALWFPHCVEIGWTRPA